MRSKIFSAAILAILFLTACGGKESKLLGSWVNIKSPTERAVLEFKKDNKMFYYTYANGQKQTTLPGEYKISKDGKYLMFKYGLGPVFDSTKIEQLTDKVLDLKSEKFTFHLEKVEDDK